MGRLPLEPRDAMREQRYGWSPPDLAPATTVSQCATAKETFRSSDGRRRARRPSAVPPYRKLYAVVWRGKIDRGDCFVRQTNCDVEYYEDEDERRVTCARGAKDAAP